MQLQDRFGVVTNVVGVSGKTYACIRAPVRTNRCISLWGRKDLRGLLADDFLKVTRHQPPDFGAEAASKNLGGLADWKPAPNWNAPRTNCRFDFCWFSRYNMSVH